MPEHLNGRPLDGVVRALAEVSWGDARKLIQSGKIRLNGEIAVDGTRVVRKGSKVRLSLNAPRPRVRRVQALERDLLVHVDASVVVVDKPAGISTVPFGDEEEDVITLDALVRDVLAKRDRIRGRAPLGVVQRLDKGTSGLLVFARTMAAKKSLAQALRNHTILRRYLAIAHGDVKAAKIESYLVENRGDGLRGSARDGRREGQLAITHVEPLESLNGATFIACRLETGRTHQIRIHLAERGHPIVGETVYVRGFPGALIPAPRLMLHAAELGFLHPESKRPMHFVREPPDDFGQTLDRLRAR